MSQTTQTGATIVASTPTDGEKMHALRAIVHGRVQGVGFRYWAHHTARRLGIAGGAIRNQNDGTVLVEAEAANRAVLDMFFHELHVGPDAAQVTQVEANWSEEAAARFPSFRIAE